MLLIYLNEDIIAEVIYCFSCDSVQECKAKLTKISKNGESTESDWAIATLDQWDRIQPELIDAWFEQTKQSSVSVSSEEEESYETIDN